MVTETIECEEVLRQAFLDSGLSIYRVCRDSGIHEPQLRRFLRRNGGLTLKSAQLLLDYFGLAIRAKEEAAANTAG